MSACHQFLNGLTRRSWLQQTGCGFGGISLAALAAEQTATAQLPASLSHFPAQAKRVIFLFMWGGACHVDLFDPKPELNRFAGQSIPASLWKNGSPPGGTLLASPFRYRQHGQSGLPVSELMPHLAEHADRLSIVRSVHTVGSAHGEALLNLHTGHSNLVRPSVGAWVSYGLGSESQNLPAFVTISPPRGHGGVQNYGSAFLPARHQATSIGSAETPVSKATISHISNDRVDRETQQRQLDLVRRMGDLHLQKAGQDSGIAGLISSYELAFRMQSEIPAVLGLEDETKETLELYGIDQEPTDNFGRQCLLARKLAERGVRYLQVSTDYTWDHHTNNDSGMRRECDRVDRPIAGLLTDLDRRGLLDDTLVVWGSEFGRTPTAENGNGRNHHPQAFSIWMAGGGVKGGMAWGSTDDFGFHPAESPMHMHDMHATLLYALGIDHEQLTYRHAGRDFRLTDVYGTAMSEIFHGVRS